MSGQRRPAVSVLIPIRAGGPLLVEVARAVRAQRYEGELELILVDSGSPSAELETLRAIGATVLSISASEFDHGATRDLAARSGRGEILVFLNQDALPANESWLDELVLPFEADDPPCAVQGAMEEFPKELERAMGRTRFFWDSCGARFYFTRESGNWIGAHGGIGFSTVNCAIARRAWQEQPLGPAPILEDKLWQQRATERGWKIVEAPAARVWHTHSYGLVSLLRRCVSEGFGWRQLGVRYRLGTALADIALRADWRELARGIGSSRVRSSAELLFPIVRPLSLWWGNRFARRARL